MTDEETILSELKARAMKAARPGQPDDMIHMAIGVLYLMDLLEEARTKLAELNSWKVQFERAGVHAAHCCTEHGCKYGKTDCPVRAGWVVQDFPCEFCDQEVI